MARRGVTTTAGTLPLDEQKQREIAEQFSTFLDRYAQEVPIRHDVVYGYKCLAMLHRQRGEQDGFKKYAANTVAAGRRLIREADQFPALRQHVPGTYYVLAELDYYCGNRSQALNGYVRAREAARKVLMSGDGADDRIERDVHATLAQSHRSIAQLLKLSDRVTALQEYENWRVASFASL
jgi:hypothetical protein